MIFALWLQSRCRVRKNGPEKQMGDSCVSSRWRWAFQVFRNFLQSLTYLIWEKCLNSPADCGARPFIPVCVTFSFNFKSTERSQKCPRLKKQNSLNPYCDWTMKQWLEPPQKKNLQSQKLWSFCSARTLNAENYMRRLAAWSLLERPNEKGSGSPNRVFPFSYLYWLQTEQNEWKTIWAWLWGGGWRILKGLGFSTGWASKLLQHRGRSKLIPLLIKMKLGESRQGLAFVFLCAGKHYDEYIWMRACVLVAVLSCICTHHHRCWCIGARLCVHPCVCVSEPLALSLLMANQPAWGPT